MMMLRYAFTAVIILNVAAMFGQSPPTFDRSQIITDIEPIICPANHEFINHHVPARKKGIRPFKKMELDIRPIYAAGVPQEVKTAFEERVFPILTEEFTSTVPIYIEINWSQTGTGTLAGASPTGFLPNFRRHLSYLNVFYPIALAEKIAREEINEPGEPDVRITINSSQNWCYDCETPTDVGPSRFDFVSTMLHELYHGIGFFAFRAVDNGVASQTSNGISAVYNYFLELRDGARTIILEDGSQELLNHFQSNQLFFNLPTGGRAKVYAPNPFEDGSSIAHLDEATYSGGPSALMTPQSGRGEVERSGGFATEMMYDMGWLYTYLFHEPSDLAIENPVDEDYVVSVDILSDNGYEEDSLRLHYSTDEFESVDIVVPFTKIDEDTYEAVIPAPNEIQVVDYYIEVKDIRNNRFSNPGINFNGMQFTNQHAFGPDTIKPILTHEPLASLKAVETEAQLFANSSDVFAGIDTVIIEWQFNGMPQPSVGMRLDTADQFEDDRYIGAIPLPSGLSETDVLEYRIVAIDRSSLENTTILPEMGFYRVEIVPVSGAVNLYNNDFNSVTDDFEGDGFRITQPAGFSSPAIHSDHPYPNAGENRTLNFIYELKTPIVLAARGQATMTYDEIVLVEPGEPGTVFGITEFWDYCIVEGKKLGTSGWRAFLDGYDSGADPDWKKAYEDSVPTGGQDASRTGDPSLYKPRVIDLLESNQFATGDTVTIRFRLFSDPFARGWGWAIDNLRIQDSSVPVEDFILERNFTLVPNPTQKEVTVALDLESVSERITISIIDIVGRRIIQDQITNPRQIIRNRYDLSGLSDGIYFVNVTFDNKETITKKLVLKK